MLAALCRARRLAAAVFFAALAVSVSRSAWAESEATGQGEAAAPGPYAIHIPDEITAGTLRRVLDGARERLSGPRCQLVFDDFRDGEWRLLRARLEETGRTPEDYLGLIVFYDGRKHPQCGRKGTLAVTHVGSRVVWVCPEELAARARRNPVWAEATLIHEVLHTLGLGENPPSSREITSQVIRRCRR